MICHDYVVVFEATRNLASGEESPRVRGVAIGGHGSSYSYRPEETWNRNRQIWWEFLEKLNAGEISTKFDNFYFVEEVNSTIRSRGYVNDCNAIRRDKDKGLWISEDVGQTMMIHIWPSPPECEELW